MSEGLVSVQVEALTNFTANDAIMNDLHISNGSVPAELESLLAIVCRARRPSSPASYIRDSTIRTIEEAAFLIKEGKTWNIFGEDADAYPVRTSDELVHYDRLGTFIRLTSVLAVPPAETFNSGSVAAHFHSQIQSVISWDYEGELEFAVDAAYFIDISMVHPDGDPVKYSAKGDFFVRTCDEKIPFLFGGVDSNCNLDDKPRMLLLVYSFMKLCRSVAPPFAPNPLAIFINKELIAEVHIFYFGNDAEIRCHRIDYDLRLPKTLAHFVLFLRNHLDTMKPLWTDHAILQKLRQAIDAIRVEIGHLVSHKVSPNDDEDDNEPSDGGIGRIDCEIANLDTPTDTWQRLLTDRRAILVTQKNKPILVAKIVGEEEWTILNSLQDVPGVVSITRHDALPDNFHLILMPWVGCSIDGYLYFTKNPSPDSRLVALSFLRSLSRIHARRIAHLDLKLTNVRVAIDDVSDGTVSIIDFGHSAILDNDSNFIEGGTGTYGWSAPEVMSGEPYDAFLADTWSAGRIIAYYAAHGPPQSVDRWLEDLGHDMQAEEPKNRTALSTAIRSLELDAENRRTVSVLL